MVNANMRGTRYIEKVMEEARSGIRKKSTPSNSVRILALLKHLYNLNPMHTKSAEEETISDQYNTLKASARRLRQKLYFDHPDMKGFSWNQVGKKYPSIKSKLTLELERIALGHGVNLHHCQEMWAADRLLFEAFRSSDSNAKDDSNDEDDEASLASALLSCVSEDNSLFS